MTQRPGALLALLNVSLGVVLLLGGPLRTSAASFDTVKMLLPIPAWGLLFLLGGLICALAADRGRIGAALVGVGAGIHACWAVALLDAAEHNDRAALTGIVIYAWAALLHFTTARRLARR